MGAMVGAGDAGFVAVEEGVFGFGGEGGEGGLEGGGSGEVVVGCEGVGEHGVFGEPGTEAAPDGDDHFLKAGGLVGGLGVEFLEEAVEGVLEGSGALEGEEDAVGEVAVFEGVFAGAELALGGNGATGFAAVGAGGCFLFVGAHGGSSGGRVAGGLWAGGAGC